MRPPPMADLDDGSARSATGSRFSDTLGLDAFPSSSSNAALTATLVEVRGVLGVESEVGRPQGSPLVVAELCTMSAHMHSDSRPPGVRCIAPVKSDVQFMAETALILQAASPVLVGDVADVEELAGSLDLSSDIALSTITKIGAEH